MAVSEREIKIKLRVLMTTIILVRKRHLGDEDEQISDGAIYRAEN